MYVMDFLFPFSFLLSLCIFSRFSARFSVIIMQCLIKFTSTAILFTPTVFFPQSKPKIETKPEKESTPKPDKKQEKENVAPSSPPASPAKPAPPPERRPPDRKDKLVLRLLARVVCTAVDWMSCGISQLANATCSS